MSLLHVISDHIKANNLIDECIAEKSGLSRDGSLIEIMSLAGKVRGNLPAEVIFLEMVSVWVFFLEYLGCLIE
ncbi:MAG: hypothetical protein WCK32_04035 [Chlorobiaceae bacterium]